MISAPPLRCIFIALCLLGVALAPTALGSALGIFGMDPRAARIAGSQLTVMAALCGAGLLLISMARWARSSRLSRTSHLHAALLGHLSADVGGRPLVLEGGGASVTAEFDGLRTVIYLSPLQGGEARLHALCMPRCAVTVCPKGLGSAVDMPGQAVVSQGAHWEAWTVSPDRVLQGAEAVLEEAFGEGGLTRLVHDADGIEILLPNGPPEHLLARLRVAIRLASATARLNR